MNITSTLDCFREAWGHSGGMDYFLLLTANALAHLPGCSAAEPRLGEADRSAFILFL